MIKTQILRMIIFTLLLIFSIPLSAYEIVIDSDLDAKDQALFDNMSDNLLICGEAVCPPWRDEKTGLIWQREPYTKKEVNCYSNNCNYGKAGNWEYAKNYCARLSYMGYSDWRLPTIKELKTLLTKNRQKSSNGHSYYIVQQLLNNMLPHSEGYAYYWSSTGYDRSGHAWLVAFDDGDAGYNAESNSHYVRCVR